MLELVLNGNFESGNFNSWQLPYPNGVEISRISNDGIFSCKINTFSNFESILTQSVSTKIGEEYILSYSLKYTKYSDEI